MGNQNKGHITVATSSTVFGRALASGKRIFQEDIKVEFLLTQEATALDALDSVTKTNLLSGLATAGLISGGEITINAGDATKFDVAAGLGVVADYTGIPFLKVIEFGPFLAESIPDLTLDFSVIRVDINSDLIKISGAFEPESAKRNSILLQTITHASQVQIDVIDNFTTPAFDYVKGLGDYVTNSPAINQGNDYVAAGANLILNKDAGVTVRAFINYRASLVNPSQIIDSAETPVPLILYGHQDGVGGFNITPATGTNLIDPEQFDDGSGTLATVPNNRFSTQMICFFSQGAATLILYGQTTYMSLAEAIADIPYQTLALNPVLSIGACVSFVVVKKGTISLQNVTDAALVTNRFNFF